MKLKKFGSMYWSKQNIITHIQPFYGLLGYCQGLPGWASIRKLKPGR